MMGKCVSFNDEVIKHYLCVWDFAYRKCREPYWEIVALDNYRFKRRVIDFEKKFIKIAKCLKKQRINT